MKKRLWILLFLLTACLAATVSASAVTNHTVKVGIKYGSNAMFSANLENAVGKGYDIGYYNSAREFVRFGSVDDTTVSVTAAGTIYLASAGYSPTTGSTMLGPYHVQLSETFAGYDEAAAEAARYSGGYPAYISDIFRVRIGCYPDAQSAQAAMENLGVNGTVVSAGKTGVMLSVTKAAEFLFEFDCQGSKHLALLPRSSGEQAVTWFRFYKYYGGFEYRRTSGGNINVINVVDLEDYVKGVIPYEMSGSWPQAALEAQAICARTYVCRGARHASTYGFDVCNTTDCQVYYGRGSGSQAPTAVSDAAVEATAGKCLYYYGSLIDAVYFSSDGGATESSENVWGGKTGYLIGKPDPYEATITIPNYRYTVTYTPEQLTWVLQHSGYSIGTIKRVYVSEYTDMGNVSKVTFVDTAGKMLTVSGSKCSSVFYSSTYNKSVRSMRFTIDGGDSTSSCFVNNVSTKLSGLDGIYCISGKGTVSRYSGSTPYAITSSGKQQLSGGNAGSGDVFTITGTGYGHNVGMSQWGAYAMAKLGYSSEEILHFYYTGVTIK